MMEEGREGEREGGKRGMEGGIVRRRERGREGREGWKEG